MATFTITTPQNITELTSKAGGDIYNINGGILTIDCDSRYGLNQSNSSSLGATTLSSTLGGSLNIDGRYVRLIPYNTGSGTLPALGSIVSKGSANGVILGVWSSLTSTPTVSGTIPASGWIKIRAWNSVAFTSGALTLSGITATCTGADIAGWIDVVGDESATLIIPRLGGWNITGNWYDLGTTTGSNSGSYQFPNSGLTTYLPGVWVETAPSSGVYEFYPNTGTVTALAANFSTDWRSKVCFVTSAGLIRFQNDGTNSTGGYLPVSGCKIRIPNVVLHNCTTALRTANALPNATLATRFEIDSTGGGAINLDKCSCGWYLNATQPYSFNLSNIRVFSTIYIDECATAMTWNQVGVGQEAATINTSANFNLDFAGGTISNLVLSRTSLASSGSYILTIGDIAGFTFNGLKTVSFTTRGNATVGAGTITRAVNSIFNNTIIGCGRFFLSTCTSLQFNTTTYFDHPALNTTSTNPMYIFDLALTCVDIKMDGVDFGGLNYTQPYNGILQLGSAGCSNIKLRNMGTYNSPLSLGAPRRDDQAWARSAAVATVTTTTPHGLVTNDTISVVVSSDISAITVAAKTITGTPSNTTFTFACLNAGSSSGTVCYFGTKCANLFVIGTGAAANNIKIQRIYAPHTRTNLFTSDNSSKNITMENVFSDYLNAPVFALLNGYMKNVSGIPAFTAQTAVYGTIWQNGYLLDVSTNTVGQAWTRSGSTVTVTSAGHSLRTGMSISVTVSSDITAANLGYRTVTVLSSSVFTFTGLSAGATSGTLTYRVGNGRIALQMNEATTETAGQYAVDVGTPMFTSAGGLFMNVGDQITFLTPDYILGQGSTFPIMEAIMGGSTLADYDLTYAIDKNDGNGFGTFHNLYYARPGGSGTSGQFTFTVTNAVGVEVGDYAWGTNVGLNAKVTNINSNTITVDLANIGTVSGILRFNHLPFETNISPSIGFKMKWRILKTIAVATAITSIYIYAESTNAGRQNQYALDTNTVTFTGLQTDSEIVVYLGTDPSTATLISSINSSGTSYSFSQSIAGQQGYVQIFHVDYQPVWLNITFVGSDISIPIQQIKDRQYARGSTYTPA